MGSGRGGLYKGTWGSHDGEILRARVGDALERFGASVAGDVAADLAEALVRIASGESPKEALPEPGEVAFDLALDALSPFVPGGGRVTRELAAAAKYSERAKRAKKSFAPRVPGEIWVEPDEYAKAMREMASQDARGQVKAGDVMRVWTDDHVYTVQIDGPDEYYIVGKEVLE